MATIVAAIPKGDLVSIRYFSLAYILISAECYQQHEWQNGNPVSVEDQLPRTTYGKCQRITEGARITLILA
jgi:hypothetical protein